VNYIISKKRGYGGKKSGLSKKEMGKLIVTSIPALFLPLGLIMALRIGLCTPTEGGALMALYSVIVGKYVYKQMKFRQLPSIMLEAVLTTAPVMLILCSANLFSYYMTWENIPRALTNVLIEMTNNKYLFLLFCNILFIIIGCFMDAMAAMIIIAPMLVPVINHFRINIIHFGLMMCLNTGLAAITPPFGTYIFLVSGTLRIKTADMIRELIPFLIASFIVLMLVTYIPWISTIIPNLMYGFT